MTGTDGDPSPRTHVMLLTSSLDNVGVVDRSPLSRTAALMSGFVRRTLLDRLDQNDETPDVDTWVEIPVDPAVTLFGLRQAVRYVELRHRLPPPDFIARPLPVVLAHLLDDADRLFLDEMPGEKPTKRRGLLVDCLVAAHVLDIPDLRDLAGAALASWLHEALVSSRRWRWRPSEGIRNEVLRRYVEPFLLDYVYVYHPAGGPPAFRRLGIPVSYTHLTLPTKRIV